MKRDWIVTGRRPAGICAAALLIASRAHGLNRKSQDVTNILRVCGVTVSNRVKEFANSPSANLSLEQFMNPEYDSAIKNEADPPVYTSNRIKEARALAIKENNLELLTSGKLDDPRVGQKQASKWRQSSNPTNKQKELKQMYNDIEMQMVEETDRDTKDKHGENIGKSSSGNNKPTNNNELQLQKVSVPEGIKYPLGNNGKDLVLPNQASVEELQKSTQKEEENIDLDSWKEEMPNATVNEVDGLFRNDEEIKQKEAIFNKMNKDYLAKQERKETERLAAESLQKEKEIEEATQVAEQARYLNKTQKQLGKRRRSDQNSSLDDNATTEEALLAALSSRKISRKINYDAMSNIFDEDGTFSTDLLVDKVAIKCNEVELF